MSLLIMFQVKISNLLKMIMMKTKVLYILLACSIIFLSACREEENLQNNDGLYTVKAGFESQHTRVSFVQNDLDLVSKWQDGDRVELYGIRENVGPQQLVNIPMRDISEDGFSATFSFSLPSSFGTNPEFLGYGFMPECHPVLIDGELYWDASMRRASLEKFKAPVYFVEQFHDDEVYATFHHYMTYEILHLKNNTDKTIKAQLTGTEGTPQWYRKTQLMCYWDHSLKVDLEHSQKPQEESDIIEVPPHETGIFVTAYMPNENKIQNMKLRMNIDNNDVRSSDTFSSDVKLETSHAYHMYAYWNGLELSFKENELVGAYDFSYVDLGLPSGTLWARYNLGTNVIAGDGNYYPWGSLTPQMDGNYSYNFTINGDLTLAQDAAAVASNGYMRMPTREEFEELLDENICKWSWNSLTDCAIVTGPNGNSIQLPASGFYEPGKGFTNDFIYGSYWSKTADGAYATELIFGTNDPDSHQKDVPFFHRYGRTGVISCARSIRPVVNQQAGTEAFVDLGLPSGNLWAICNAGARTSRDYGNYIAWGETIGYNEGYTTFSWSKYKFCRGASNTLTKYCSNRSYGYNGFTDNLTQLLAEDDYASTFIGNNCSIPTKADWDELIRECKWSKLDNGALVRGKNGNVIFLPCAGYRSGVNLYDNGSEGYYWTSSLDVNSPDDAWFVYIGGGKAQDYDYYRCMGRSIRPIMRNGSRSSATKSMAPATNKNAQPTAKTVEGGMVVKTMSGTAH